MRSIAIELFVCFFLLVDNIQRCLLYVLLGDCILG